MKTIKYKAKSVALIAAITLTFINLNAQNVIENLDIATTDATKVTGGTTIFNLTVRADKSNCGQLIVESGVVNVKRLTYKFTVQPLEWTMIAVPSDIADVNLPEFTNFAALGMTQGSGAKYFTLKTYNPSRQANGADPWEMQRTPGLTAYQAYMFYVWGFTDPVELEFYFDNVTLDKTKNADRLLVDLDLTGKAVQQTYPVKIKAANARSNTLEVAVYNDPEATPAPINYANAVNDANLYFTENKDAFRISLPNSEPCKVLIMDKKMKKILRAAEYTSPAAIPLDGLKRGVYSVYIEYGGASAVKQLKIK